MLSAQEIWDFRTSHCDHRGYLPRPDLQSAMGRYGIELSSAAIWHQPRVPTISIVFCILMTVMMHDCKTHIPDAGDMLALLYADDTLLVGSDPSMLQHCMHIIANQGRKYGLKLNNSKLELMQIHGDATIRDSDGNAIKKKESIKYLGALLHKSGQITAEIGCKIGIAKQEFRILERIWKHANISQRRKIELYKSLILSKFLYGLQTVWLSKVLRRRIDGFHCSCLRQILGIPHSYVSRVTNVQVLQ